jgi:hypothetical protein
MDKFGLALKTLIGFATFSIVSGCGGSSSGTSNPIDLPVAQQQPLSANYYGTWQIDNENVVMVSETSLVTFSFNPNLGCYESGMFVIDASTENTVTSRDIETGELTTSNFSLSGSVLTVEEGSDTLQFEQSSESFFTPACESKHNVSELSISLTMDYLPPTFLVNRDAQSTGSPEYSYRVHFDLNSNSVEDGGDLYVQLFHFKGSSLFSANEQVDIEQIGGKVWVLAPLNGREGVSSIAHSLYSPVALTLNENQLTFDIETTGIAQLAHLSPSTPVKIETYISYPQPETEVINGWVDGPWNWTSENHRDNYPDEGWIAPNQSADHLDGRADFDEGESSWVDIIEVSFDFK